MSLPRKFNTWRKHGVWKRLVHSWLPRLSRNLGAATGAVTLWWQAYLPISARTVKTILPVWPTFPARCGTDGFFHFSICCSNRLGWYWGRQRTSWIRKIVTVFRCRKNFVREIFVVTDKREIFLTAKISQYTVQLYQTPHKMARRLHSGGVVEDDCRYYELVVHQHWCNVMSLLWLTYPHK